MGKHLVSLLIVVVSGLASAASAISWASEPTAKAKIAVPNKYELPFTATTGDAALAWQAKARRRLLELVAAQTPRHSLVERPLDFQTESSEDRGAYVLYHASFQCNDGQRRKCLWAVPKGGGPFPGMLCLHGHGGSAELVFNAKSIYRGCAERFARGGYCVLAPSFPHRTYAASTLWDLIRCVDILAAQKEVDRKRMGVMGLSMGGEWTMWVAACDTRLRAAVVSGWMCTTEGVFAVPNCPCWQLPGFVNLMDVCEVHLLIAARPVLFESAEGDPCFPIRYTREGFARIRAGYRVFGAEGACAQDVFPGGHVVHGNAAYPFIDKTLGGHAAVEEALANAREKQQHRVELNHASAGQLQVLIDGKEAIVYQYGKDVDLPHYYPVRSPSGRMLTVEQAEPYPHQRSIWLADSIQLTPRETANFYMSVYSKDKQKPEAGFRYRIRHVKFLKQEVSAGRAIIEAQLVWEADYGKTPMLDEWRRCRVVPLGSGEYLLDMSFRLTASYGDANFVSDRTHYAWPYVRVSPQFSVAKGGGTMTSSEGIVTNREIDRKGMYAHRANWVDYSNTAGSFDEGLAIFATDAEAPRWFTRDYGAFGPRRPDAQSGRPFVLKKGDSLRQHVGMLIHSGDVVGGRVKQRYEQFIAGKL